MEAKAFLDLQVANHYILEANSNKIIRISGQLPPDLVLKKWLRTWSTI